MSENEFIQVGFIRGAHALKGHINVHVFTGEEESLVGYGPLCNADGTKWFDFTITGFKQGDFMCSLPDVTDRNAAEALKGTKLYVPVSALPELEEDTFYFKDLIGLTALSADGTVLGKVKSVNTFGGNDALEIDFVHNGTEALPAPQSEFVLFTKVNVPEINVATGTLTLEIPFGLFEAVEKDAD